MVCCLTDQFTEFSCCYTALYGGKEGLTTNILLTYTLHSILQRVPVKVTPYCISEEAYPKKRIRRSVAVLLRTVGLVPRRGPHLQCREGYFIFEIWKHLDLNQDFPIKSGTLQTTRVLPSIFKILIYISSEAAVLRSPAVVPVPSPCSDWWANYTLSNFAG